MTPSKFAVACVVLLGCAPAWPGAEDLPVVPGIEGFGTGTPAGRGGKILRVTNLLVAGPGSLAACIETPVPRVCVFEVSGTVVLDRNLVVEHPFITIAGQTAPAPGITLRGGGIFVRTHDVLIQHLRVRVGGDPTGAGGTAPCCRDGLNIGYKPGSVYNVVVDHVSVSWAVDENVDIGGEDTRAITLHRSIVSEGLGYSIHKKTRASGAPHSMGILIDQAAHDVSLIGNLLIHNGARNPRVSGNTATVFANNLVVSWQQAASQYGSRDGSYDASIVGNVYARGPESVEPPPVRISGDSAFLPRVRIYLADNRFMERADPPWAVAQVRPPTEESMVRVDAPPVWPSGFQARPSSSIEDWVLSGSGARPRDRDMVDRRLIDEARGRRCSRTRAGSPVCIVDAAGDVGGWPRLSRRVEPLVLPPRPSHDDDNDGYTNLEEWLHERAAALEP